MSPLSHEKPPSSVERRRSDSHNSKILYRSSSPASTQRTVSVNISPDRPLPLRPDSNESRQEKQGDTSKRESGSLLDEVMERYERKELETRKAHEKELRKLQKEHDMSLERLGKELAKTRQSHSVEVRSLKEEKHAAEAKWQSLYNSLETEREEAHIARRELEELKASHTVELQGERQLLENAHINRLQQDSAKLADKYEHKLQEQAEKHQQTARRMQEQSDGRVAEMRQKMADQDKYVQVQAHKMDRITSHESSLQKEADALKKQCDDLQAMATAQKLSLAAEIKKQSVYYSERSVMHEERLEKQQVAHNQERANFEERLKKQQTEFVQDMQKRVAYYEDLNDRLRADHRQQLETATLGLNKRILSLESDLIDNGDDMRPSLGGGPLQSRYRQLKLKVETITEPFNLAEMRSPHGFATDELDQRGFLAKEGKAQLRFLLRSICWSIIMGGFFSSPFGFGAFGPGEGKKLLLEVYATWQKLFDPKFTGFIASPELSGQEDFEPFYNDKFANWWRAATFQSIQSAVFRSRRTSQVGEPTEAVEEMQMPQGIAKVFAGNMARVKSRILGVITKACGVDKASEAIEGEVEDLVRCASLLAVEFGAHGAKICFGMPKFGDTVQIGTEFVDCEDGDSNRGKLETVELAVSPSLFMIGDGRKDLTTATCLFPGEIYPRRES
ncbi:hypothetical protein QBC37DRAFT_431426 [Rhypophila decipiens]|uniref:Uncharacterized protein n=1 Tax=Rhypophila decipiens TaxID=261697 RepID=A0AAN6Y3M8_9PEZI|nr:hypothetical protein QBC37DRAFT_431426 [Rhypophila decipiens]